MAAHNKIDVIRRKKAEKKYLILSDNDFMSSGRKTAIKVSYEGKEEKTWFLHLTKPGGLTLTGSSSIL